MNENTVEIEPEQMERMKRFCESVGGMAPLTPETIVFFAVDAWLDGAEGVQS
jgi:hypothetical protein